MNYIVSINDGKFSIFTKTKKIFREKLKKVNLNEFFNFSAMEMLKKGTYKLFPETQGLSAETYLAMKAEYNLHNGYSDFNQRTIWRLNNFSNDFKEINIGDKVIYQGNITADLSVTDKSGNVFLKTNNFSFNFADNHIVSQKEAELLLQNAANGNFTSARDRFNYIDIISKEKGLEGAKLECEECGEVFDNLAEFFSHLIETGHHDSILDIHKNDPEIIKLNSLISKNKENC